MNDKPVSPGVYEPHGHGVTDHESGIPLREHCLAPELFCYISDRAFRVRYTCECGFSVHE